MNDTLLNGTWKGSYQFYLFPVGTDNENNENSEDFEPILEDIKFNFEVKFESSNGEFIGQAIEETIKFDKPILIKGFFENDFISFEKKYPYLWTVDEDGNNILDKTKPHNKIYKTGVYDEIKMTLSGDWEMPVEIINNYDGVINDAYCAGIWELKKVNS